MMTKKLACGFALAVAVLLPTPGQAQYYAPPQQGYYPPPPRDPYYRPEPRYGARCNARMRTPYGPRQVICRIVEPKPLGMECACPPPPPPPGFAPGPFVPGRTVR